jgi:uncharacterized protein DUF1839
MSVARAGVERAAGSLTGHAPATYDSHPLHAGSRDYAETNCYTDILIELLHARRLEPLAAFSHLVRMDFEGDQWTFFKPPPEDIERLYGIDIHEMQPYRPIPEQMAEQLAQGRTMIVELDSFFMPDTAATSYGREHVKSSVIADAIDLDAQRLAYFHGRGLYELGGEDFRGIFRIGDEDPTHLPPYTELVRFDVGEPLSGEDLRTVAFERLGHHLARRPATNPFERFGAALARDLPALLAGGMEDFHAYAFATVRMAGSAFEVAGAHARWLLGAAGEEPAAAMDEIVAGCKALSFRLARRREFDPQERIAALADAWTRAIGGLSQRAG